MLATVKLNDLRIAKLGLTFVGFQDGGQARAQSHYLLHGFISNLFTSFINLREDLHPHNLPIVTRLTSSRCHAPGPDSRARRGLGHAPPEAEAAAAKPREEAHHPTDSSFTHSRIPSSCGLRLRSRTVRTALRDVLTFFPAFLRVVARCSVHRMRLRFSRHRAAPTGWNVSIFMDPGVRGFDCSRTRAHASKRWCVENKDIQVRSTV